jgi:soluble lytic murein transglycosylase-like protein
MKARFLGLFAALLVVVSAAPASAEIAFFSSGRTLSIKEHRMDGDSLVLVLRAGGEIVCDAATIARFAPDEVPYPEPAADAAASAVANPDEVTLQADSTPFGDIIDRVSKQQDVDAKLVRAVIRVESGYQQRARSAKGAMGLMQLMPETARQYAVRDPYDPASNIEAGIKHLKGLLQRFPTVALALAAYNAGEAAVQRFHGIPPYPETRDYVTRILQLAQLTGR